MIETTAEIVQKKKKQLK